MSNMMTGMLQKLFTSKLRVDLLSLFFGRSDEEFYVRQIEKILGEDVGNISRELRNLESVGLLASRKAGNQKYYLLDRAFPLHDELRSMVVKTTGVAGLLTRCLSKMEKIDYAFIYGSFAVGQERTGSDVDLMVIGGVSLEELIRRLKEPEATLGREIQPSLYSMREVAKRLREKEPFISRVMKEPKIMLIGEEDGLRRIGKKRPHQAI